MSTAVETALNQAYRDDRARMIATLVRSTRDFDAAEDALQDAITRAMTRWPGDGIPANPAGWLVATARNIVIDTAHRNSSFREKMPLLIVDDEPDQDLHSVDLAFGDDRLRLIFTCCHPILAPESRVALTLRMICGLTTAEIARLFLVPEPTMAARITRAKKKITASGVPYRIPAPEDLGSRLADVLVVIYLVATEAHTPGEGEALYHASHMQLALDLTRIMMDLMPNHPDVMSLRALILFTEARRHTRVDDMGMALTLDAMDRSRWDRALIDDGITLTTRSLALSQPDTVGPYTLQAAIAAIHAEAPAYEQTDWEQIVMFYAMLERITPTAVVRLGKAVAIGMRDGPEAGLALIDASDLDTEMASYPMLPAARADFHKRAGHPEEAAFQYRLAADRTGNRKLQQWFRNQAKHIEAS